jgi:Spy/CpxP family protein refolding chaperone
MKSGPERTRIVVRMKGDTNPMQRLGITALFIAAIATSLVAQPRRPIDRHDAPPPPNGDALVNYLNLTADQKTAWTAARAAFETTVAPLYDKIESTQNQLRQLMDSKSNDATVIGTLMIAIRDGHDQIKAQHDALDTKLESVLTADQMTKFAAFRAARAAADPDGPPHPPMAPPIGHP